MAGLRGIHTSNVLNHRLVCRPRLRVRDRSLCNIGKGSPRHVAYQPLMSWNVVAQTKLGIMYEDRHGVQQDPIQAYMWFTVAAEKGSILANVFQDALGRQMTATQIAEARATCTGLAGQKQVRVGRGSL